jgi:capsid protein
MVLQFIGVNLGLPLVLMLLDASETNFSGYRGAVDQARMGFRRNQDLLCGRWCRPYYRFKVERWLSDDRALRELAATSGVDVYRHTWKKPAWPYIEPTKDATADLIRAANGQTSLTRLAQERGLDFADIAQENVRDRGYVVELALKRAAELNTEFKLKGEAQVNWRDLAALPMASGITVAISAGDDQPEAAKPQGSEDGGQG